MATLKDDADTKLVLAEAGLTSLLPPPSYANGASSNGASTNGANGNGSSTVVTPAPVTTSGGMTVQISPR